MLGGRMDGASTEGVMRCYVDLRYRHTELFIKILLKWLMLKGVLTDSLLYRRKQMHNYSIAAALARLRATHCLVSTVRL